VGNESDLCVLTESRSSAWITFEAKVKNRLSRGWATDIAQGCTERELTALTEPGGGLAVAPRAERVLPERQDQVRETTREAAAKGAPTSVDEPHILERVAAERRVERYLAGFGMARGRRRELVVQGCIARALEQWRQEPGSDLPWLALEQAEDAVANWFRAVLGDNVVGDSSPLLVGRAVFEICQASGRWPGVLATCDRLPLAADGALQQAPRPIPPEVLGAMTPQPLEPWSADDILIRLRSLATRWGAGGTTAA
jgi:hypothetical protein